MAGTDSGESHHPSRKATRGGKGPSFNSSGPPEPYGGFGNGLVIGVVVGIICMLMFNHLVAGTAAARNKDSNRSEVAIDGESASALSTWLIGEQGSNRSLAPLSAVRGAARRRPGDGAIKPAVGTGGADDSAVETSAGAGTGAVVHHNKGIPDPTVAAAVKRKEGGRRDRTAHNSNGGSGSRLDRSTNKERLRTAENGTASSMSESGGGAGAFSLMRAQCMARYGQRGYLREDQRRLPPMLYTFPGR